MRSNRAWYHYDQLVAAQVRHCCAVGLLSCNGNYFLLTGRTFADGHFKQKLSAGNFTSLGKSRGEWHAGIAIAFNPCNLSLRKALVSLGR
jgi:hypothetical protein